MRKESKERKTIKGSRIQGYHEGMDWSNRELYATAGFEGGFKVFASDRAKAADGAAKTYGIEIELESAQRNPATLAFILEHGAFEIFPAGLFKMQHDGSLAGHTSAEVISQPMTKAFIRNHYNGFRAMWQFMKEHDTAPGPSCGMHTIYR